MGLLDFLTGKIQCPSCGRKGARKSEDRIRCPNPSCPYFDASLARRQGGTTVAKRGDFSPARPLAIRYRNFQGQEKTFTADAESAARKKNHIVVRVVPTGERIALSRDRIQNLHEVEGALPSRPEPAEPSPTPRERRVLTYHKNRKTTSPLYEQIRAKYPDW